jgi:hypothetical protein
MRDVLLEGEWHRSSYAKEVVERAKDVDSGGSPFIISYPS